MRDIKFRVLVWGKWLYGMISPPDYVPEVPMDEFWRGVTGGSPWCLESLGQFTGLHDRFGVEIYEGDVVVCNGPCVVEWDKKAALWWANDRWGVYGTSAQLSNVVDEGCELMGNIHQNPELKPQR